MAYSEGRMARLARIAELRALYYPTDDEILALRALEDQERNLIRGERYKEYNPEGWQAQRRRYRKGEKLEGRVLYPTENNLEGNLVKFRGWTKRS